LRTLPNSSASISVSGMVAALRATSGRSRTADRPWMARAASSLPTPLSPRSKVWRSVEAANAQAARRRHAASLSPTMP
jgi:hypothetical protein